MPAAAVIPAPIVYIKVAAVEKLVVGRLSRRVGLRLANVSGPPVASSREVGRRLTAWPTTGDIYFEEIRVIAAGKRFEYGSME